jgi:acetyl esterase/lipase
MTMSKTLRQSTLLFRSLLLAALAFTASAQSPAPTAPSAPARSAGTTQTTADYTRTEDVVYGRKFGVALTLDVFQPARGANGFGVIYLVSGGWRSSHEGVNPKLYAPYLERGYTVFAVVHGSQPKFIITEIVPDIHRAIRFIRHHAAQWGVNPQRLGLTGASAGGHLSLTLGTQGGPGNPKDKDPIERESSAVQTVACFYPPTDFLNYGREGEDAVGVGILKNYVDAFGPEAATAEGRKKLGAAISPARFVTAQLPPTLIVHGDADALVPIQQAELFVQRATAAGATARLIVKPGAKHGWPDSAVDRMTMAAWFDQYLRGVK